jgi:D-arginine dehydrogenase
VALWKASVDQMIECDVCVVGAGIAGASLAGRLAADRSVVLIEAEAHPGMHTTGRSVAIYTETLPGAQIQPLTSASRDFFHAPPDGFSATPLIRRRDVVQFGRTDQFESLRALQKDLRAIGAEGRWLQRDEILSLIPILRPESAAGAVLDQGSFDMDVDALHQAWLRRLRGLGGTILTDAPLKAAAWSGSRWRIQAGENAISCAVLANAAGAWGDLVAGMAGVRPLGLQPKRRTISVMSAEPYEVNPWPMGVDADNLLYFKPDAGRLLVSAMEQTPSAPCDAYPDDLEVAQALDLFARTVTLPVRRPQRSWAGLRTFAPDNQPVAGYDAEQPGFFWLVGQGGAGIQTSPALSETAAALVRGDPVPEACAKFGVSAEGLSPRRFR